MVGHVIPKVAAYVKLLKRARAPDDLIADFEEIVAIDNVIAEESRDLESLDRLLLDVCKKHGFARVFDKSGARAWIRPCLIADEHPDSHADMASSSDDHFNPVVEQAYRRGYDHGFDEAKRLAEQSELPSLCSRSAEIYKWRRAPIFYGASFPGTVQDWGIEASVRSSLPAKRRFDVLERDKRKCVVCGRSASDGIVLHVDHVVAVRNGGSNEFSNLQTLCEECNLGKGAR